MPYPKCKEFCASTGVRHEEAKLKGQGPGLLEFKGQGPEMVNVEELCWCVRPYTQRTFTSPGPWPLNKRADFAMGHSHAQSTHTVLPLLAKRPA